MGKKINTVQFINKAIEIHGDKYDYSKVDYSGSSNKIKIICLKHGEFEQRAGGHLSGKGCIKCGREKTENAHRINIKTFINKAKKIHGNKYDYSKVNYKNNSTNIIIICPEHGEFNQAPANHLVGKGCIKCGRERTSNAKLLDLNEFIKKAKQIHGDIYDYSRVNYKGRNKKITIICPKHGEFPQLPSNHLKGKKCSICAGADRNIDTKKCIDRSIKVHGNKYNYSQVVYERKDKHIKIICPKHGIFNQTPGKHWKGRGCIKCQYCPNCFLCQTNGRLCSYCKPKKDNKQYQKTKEFKVVEYMRNNIDKLFVHNKSVGNDCTKNDREKSNGHLYPDLRWDCNWFQLILEVDEFQHRGADYECDERRMYDIIAKLGMSCVFIRYNPDNKNSNLDVLQTTIKKYLKEEGKIKNSNLKFSDFGLITEYLFYK